MGVRMAGISGLVDPRMIDQLVEAEKIPISQAKKRRELISNEKKEFDKLVTIVNEFEGSLNGLKTKGDFYKLKVESSHPDIMDGVVEAYALPGTYEFEVRGMARSEKELAYGFPDKDKTPVGFGFMEIEVEGQQEPFEVTIEPNATLQDVANVINQADAGVRAMVINTKYDPDAFRLIVLSEKSGKESRIFIDEDTTFLEFKEQVTGRNLDILFEDVPITDTDNNLEDLIEGVVFNVKRAEPGTRVQVNIAHDVEKTVESIKGFVEKYNKIASFVHDQFAVNPETQKAGLLAGDSSLKTILRSLQSAIIDPTNNRGKYNNLADIGITTDPKSGQLNINESKVRQSLAENYDGVANLFVRAHNGIGIADRLGEKIKNFKDPVGGVLKSKTRSLEQVIKNQDNDIERKERQLEQKEEMIRKRFTNLESQLAGMKSQGDFLQAKFGSGGGGVPMPG